MENQAIISWSLFAHERAETYTGRVFDFTIGGRTSKDELEIPTGKLPEGFHSLAFA